MCEHPQGLGDGCEAASVMPTAPAEATAVLLGLTCLYPRSLWLSQWLPREPRLHNPEMQGSERPRGETWTRETQEKERSKLLALCPAGDCSKRQWLPVSLGEVPHDLVTRALSHEAVASSGINLCVLFFLS